MFFWLPTLPPSRHLGLKYYVTWATPGYLIWIKPGERFVHSPVIQATGEARIVGWLEAERSLPPRGE